MLIQKHTVGNFINAAIDTDHTAVFSSLFGENGLLQGRAVILVTHNGTSPLQIVPGARC